MNISEYPPRMFLLIIISLVGTITHLFIEINPGFEIKLGLLALVCLLFVPVLVWYDTQLLRQENIAVNPWYFIPLSILPYGVSVVTVLWYAHTRSKARAENSAEQSERIEESDEELDGRKKNQ